MSNQPYLYGGRGEGSCALWPALISAFDLGDERFDLLGRQLVLNGGIFGVCLSLPFSIA